MSTRIYFEITNELSGLEKSGNKDPKDLVDSYFHLFSKACDTITIEDVLDMSQPQCLALLQLVLDTVTGRAHAEIEKKKMEIRGLGSVTAPAFS